MAKYIGQNLSHGVFTRQDILPVRLLNGEIEDTYTLQHRVPNESSIIVACDKLILQPSVDYVIVQDSQSFQQKIKFNVNLAELDDIDGEQNNLKLYVLYLGKELLQSSVPSIDSIHDVSVFNPVADQVLKYNGTGWVNADVSNIDPTPAVLAWAQNYITSRISEVVNAAPETLDTLKEIADALGSDQNFSTTITNQLGNLNTRLTTVEFDVNSLTPLAYSASYTDLINAPILSTVATSGSYTDLIDTPTLFSGSYDDLTGTPTLFSGSYNDLTDTPTLATVATSGSYNDLNNKPTTPSVVDGNLIISDKTPDDTWQVLNDTLDTITIHAVVKNGNVVYVGGEFTSINGVTANNIAQWNGTSWSALGTGTLDPVYALAVDSSGNLLAGGAFTNIGGVAANRIARWNGSSWSALGTGLTGTAGFRMVNAIAVDGTIVYAGGSNINSAGGVAVSNIAVWNGSSWSALGTGVNGTVNTIIVNTNPDLIFTGNRPIFVGGDFTTAGGVTVNRIAKWNGSSWFALSTGMNGAVNALAFDSSDNLYAAGSFSTAGGATVNRIAKWNGTSWSALGSGIDGGVTALAVNGSDVYVGGYFTAAGDATANNIARWNSLDNIWMSVGTGLDPTDATAGIRDIFIDSNFNLIVGGFFKKIGNITTNSISLLNLSSLVTKLGIGTSNPNALLHLRGNTGDAKILLQSTAGENFDQSIQFKDTTSDWFVGNKFSVDVKGFGIGRTQSKNDFVIDSIGNVSISGNVGIGTSSPAYKLDIIEPYTAHSNVNARFGTTGGASGYITTSANSAHFTTDTFNRNCFRLNADTDSADIWTFDPALNASYLRFEVSQKGKITFQNGSVCILNNAISNSAGSHALRYNFTTGVVTYDISSSLMKNNIVDCPYGLQTIMNLRPRKYFRIDDQREEIGFVADELLNLIPELVTCCPKSLLTKNEDDVEIIAGAVMYEKLTSVLCKALQELNNKVDVIQSENIALKAEIEALKAK